MNNYMPTPNFYDDYIAHYGVLGMRWGVRKEESRARRDAKKNNKWAKSKNQPSSFKSSLLAGTYAATGNKKIGKALDKSNSADEKRWKNAQKIKKENKKNPKYDTSWANPNRISSKISERGKLITKRAAIAGLALSALSVAQTARNVKAVNKLMMSSDMGKLPVSHVLKKGSAKALAVGGLAFGAAVAGQGIHDYLKEKKKMKSNQ